MAAQQVAFEFSAIPDSSRTELLTIIHGEVAAFFAKPGVAEAFEEWQKKQTKGENQ